METIISENAVIVDNNSSTTGNNNNEDDLQASRKNLQDALAGLNLQFEDQDKLENSSDQKSELLIGATQTVVSFVFFNKQASLFNLLIQMLTTNTFSPASLQSNIPFQPSPTPITIKQPPQQQQQQQQQPQPQPQQQEGGNSSNQLNGSSNSAFSQSSNIIQNPKSSMMFNILHEAINSVSQQFQKNFYLYILEKQEHETVQGHDQLVAGCLSFINHMLSAAPTFFDFERYRQLLSSQGVNDLIKTYIKSVHPDTRSELLHFQKHKTNSIKIAKQTTSNDDKPSINSFLSRLLKMSFPSDQDQSDIDKLRKLGFETSEPIDELLSTGILGLRNLIYFSARYFRIYNEILEAQSSSQNPNPYSFIRVGMNLTNVLYEIYIEDENIYEIIFDQDDWFEELFCISFELFDEIWEREGKAEEDFIPVLVKTRTILSRLKWTNPDSIQSFQVTLGNVLDEMWTKIENNKEEKEMSARVGGLSDSILGLPYIPGAANSHLNGSGGSGNPSPTYRFQKFFGEKFKTHRKSTEFPVYMDDTSSVNSDKSSSSAHKEVVVREKEGHTHRIHTKSLSFKKLFSDLKFDHSNSSERKLSNSSQTSVNNNSYPPESAETTIPINSSNGGSSSLRESQQLQNPNESDLHSSTGVSSSVAGDSPDSPSQFEKLGSMAKKFIKTVKAKTKSGISSSTSSTNISNSNDSESANGNTLSQSVDNVNNDQSEKDAGKFIKSSGSYIYQTVKKATVKMAKKTKTITKRVKRKKVKKTNGDASLQMSNSGNSSPLNGSGVAHSSSKDAISIYANGDIEFKPSLDLDFDRNSDDSSYEYTDEEIEVDDDTNTIDDIQSMESSYDNSLNASKLIKSRSVEVLSKSQQEQQMLSENQPTTISITVSNEQQAQQQNTPGISSSTSQELLHPPMININSRTESEQSLTDAATLNSVLKQKQQQQQQQIKPNSSSGENSPRSNNGQSPNHSPKVSRSHTLDLKKPVLSRAPIPAQFIAQSKEQSPSLLAKSPSIKHLVNFFEVKSTTSSTTAPTLQREKSFKSTNDTSSNVDEEKSNQ
ncbi:engulfment and cell motility ELM family protein [Tieghemostelium lacteum]|uniref:Engulfment and cell motility ELM family protein n=1 Tax=Tieghemostelium lacteum TaxID=361077 RepID=A0A151ZJ70_TIELA|nr:engulfment and cell motility ELM family protein [Tieghemostelium lacteum]|eukprot:KYQ94041.1 engulfment and cell motility ELM family protein [Tieghemostelium lacteum]